MWKEKYEALTAELKSTLGDPSAGDTFIGEAVRHLVASHDALAKRVAKLEGKDSAAESRLGSFAADKTAAIPTPKGDPAVASSNGAHRPAQAMFNLFIEMAKKDPIILRILDERPELRITREIRTVQAHASTLKGALGILISEKFFDSARPFDDVRKEFIRRGFIAVKTPSRQIEGAIDSLVEMGFLTKEETGLLAVPGMKINIVEARG